MSNEDTIQGPPAMPLQSSDTAESGQRNDADLPALLAAFDEALKRGHPDTATTEQAGVLPSGDHKDLRRAQACLRLLEEVFPRVTAGPDGAGPMPAANVPAALGRFQIRRELGRGGFGIVYLAHDPKLGRDVALKVPHGHAFADAEVRGRFEREAQAAAGLDHPNLVTVYEAGEADRVAYIAFAYCPGISLADWLRQRTEPMPAHDAAGLIATLAAAVHYAHVRGIVHRDLKPANVLLVSGGVANGGVANGNETERTSSTHHSPLTTHPSPLSPLTTHQPKIADFGLAKNLDDQAPHTQSGTIAGTPSYMAPEQAGGKRAAVGPATDVYALGTILYELLTGRAPFQGDSILDTLHQVRNAEPIPPSRLRARLSRDLETICLKCLQKEPDKRYASARALADDLERFRAGQPILARPVRWWQRAWKWARRRPAVAALALLLLLIPTVGLPLVTWLWQDAVTAGEQTRKALEEEERQRQAAEQQRLAAEANLAALRVALAHREWLSEHVEQAEQLLDLCPPGHRPWEWHYVKRLCHKELHTLRGHAGSVVAVAYSHDGKRLASGAEHMEKFKNTGLVKVWDAETGRNLLSLSHTAGVRAVAFSRDGLLLASADFAGEIRLWDAVSGEPRGLLKGHTAAVNTLAFHPDSTRLASAGYDNVVRIWDVRAAKEVLQFRETKGLVYRVETLAYSPDGNALVSGGTSRFVKVWDGNTGKELFRLGPHLSDIHCVAFRPDGRQLASGSFDKTVRVWDVAKKEIVQILHGHTRGVDAVAFAPDGKAIVSGARGSGHGEIKLWDPVTGAEKGVFRGHRGGVTALAFRQDGRRLASASIDQTVKIWDAAGHQEAALLRGVGEAFAFSPDGKHLAAVFQAKSDQRVKFWDAVTLQSADLRLEGEKATRKLAYSPDGKMLAAVDISTLRIWDAASGRLRREVELRARPSELCWRPDGAALAVALDNVGVKIWNVDSGALEHPIHLKGNISSVDFDRDGQRLLTAGWEGVAIWDAGDGKLVRDFGGKDNAVTRAVFSPDGKSVACAGRDHLVHVWDIAAGKTVFTLSGHSHAVLSVAFSPDGRRLASAATDGAVKLWDTQTGREVLTLHKWFSDALPGVFAIPQRLRFSPDGLRLAAWYGDNSILIWDATPLE